MAQIHPKRIPTQKEEILRHRDNPTLVREFTLGLPEGYSLFYFCTVVLGYDDLDPYVHGSLCEFLEHPKYGRFRDATVPRSWFKTSVATIGKNLWLPIRRDRNIKILIAMNTADNAEKRLHVIRHHWQNNKLLQAAFSELVPDFKKVRWSNQCAEINRTRQSDEGTYESIGSGGAVVSRHYDHIDEDDLVYAKKDDLSGAEIQPNREDIEKAIGWHKLVYSLFSDPGRSTIDNIGTRWAVHDLKDWIKKFEGHKYKFFRLAAENNLGEPIWPGRFSHDVLQDIRTSQGEYMYQTQYLNNPRDPADAAFQEEWLEYFQNVADAPRHMKLITVVDLACWGDSKGLARNVVLTCGIDARSHLWMLRYDRGKFNPEETIKVMEQHAQQFKTTKVFVEEVQYQRAIRFYAKKRMEKTGFFYRLEPLPTDNRTNAKDLRIRDLINLCSHGGLHIRYAHTKFKEEFCDYPSGLTCDILDCLAWAHRKLQGKHVGLPDEKPVFSQFELGNILQELEENKKSNMDYPFDLQCRRAI